MEPPQKPSESDCCGSGCDPCVFDVYEQLLEKWRMHDPNSNLSENIRHDLLSPLKYKPYKLLSIEEVGENVNIYRFRPLKYEKGDSLGFLPYEPGQHFIIVKPKPETSLFSRAYTPITISKKEKNCDVKFLIKLYKYGLMSAVISFLKIGDLMYFRGPYGDFKHILDSAYIMFCAGTGIAPMYSIVKTILENENDETKIRLHFACSTMDDIYFRDEIRQFSKFWNFTAYVYVSKLSPMKSVKYDENIHFRKLSGNDITNEISNHINYKILICGSYSFNSDVCKFAELAGIQKSKLFVF